MLKNFEVPIRKIYLYIIHIVIIQNIMHDTTLLRTIDCRMYHDWCSEKCISFLHAIDNDNVSNQHDQVL